MAWSTKKVQDQNNQLINPLWMHPNVCLAGWIKLDKRTYNRLEYKWGDMVGRHGVSYGIV